MIPRRTPARRGLIVAALGSSLTVSWAYSYYIPAVLSVPMAEDLGLSPVWVCGAFSMAMVVAGLVGPWAGARIDGAGGRGVLMLSNLVFAAGLGLLALAPTPLVLFAGWAVIGLGMGIGLHEAGFATLAGIYGKEARGPITGITLMAKWLLKDACAENDHTCEWSRHGRMGAGCICRGRRRPCRRLDRPWRGRVPFAAADRPVRLYGA